MTRCKLTHSLKLNLTTVDNLLYLNSRKENDMYKMKFNKKLGTMQFSKWITCVECGFSTDDERRMHYASQWLNIRKQNKYYFTLCPNCCNCSSSGNCEKIPQD